MQEVHNHIKRRLQLCYNQEDIVYEVMRLFGMYRDMATKAYHDAYKELHEEEFAN